MMLIQAADSLINLKQKLHHSKIWISTVNMCSLCTLYIAAFELITDEYINFLLPSDLSTWRVFHSVLV